MKKIIALLIIILNTTGAFAQKSIDKVIKDIANDRKCEVVYTEERHPNTKTIIRSKIIATINNTALVRKLEEAFKKERDNAISIKIITKDGYFKLKFQEQTNITSEYTLCRADDKWQLIAKKTGAKLISKNKSIRNIDNYGCVIEKNMENKFKNMENKFTYIP